MVLAFWAIYSGIPLIAMQYNINVLQKITKIFKVTLTFNYVLIYGRFGYGQ